MFHRTTPYAVTISIAIAMASSTSAAAGTIFSIGGGIATENTFESHSPAYAALGWVGVRAGIDERWSAFVRVGYEGHSISEGLATCSGLDCPSSARSVKRVEYIPVSWGVRLSSLGSTSSRPFLELGSSLSWARFEDGVRLQFPEGRSLREEEHFVHSKHWLVGIEVGAGVYHPLRGRTGLEWGIRYAYSGAPRRTSATEEVEAAGVSRTVLTVALTR